MDLGGRFGRREWLKGSLALGGLASLPGCAASMAGGPAQRIGRDRERTAPRAHADQRE